MNARPGPSPFTGSAYYPSKCPSDGTSYPRNNGRHDKRCCGACRVPRHEIPGGDCRGVTIDDPDFHHDIPVSIENAQFCPRRPILALRAADLDIPIFLDIDDATFG